MKDWIKGNFKKLTIGIVIIAVLTAAFFVGGQTESSNNISVVTEQSELSKTITTSGLSDDESKEEFSDHTSSVVSKELPKIVSAAESSKSVSKNSKESSAASKSESIDINESLLAESSVQSSIPQPETARPSDDKPKETSKNTSSKSEQSDSVSAKNNTESSKPAQQSSKTSTPTEKSTVTQESSKLMAVSEPSKENKQGNLSCTLTISCATAISNSSLSRAKRSVLPADGMILSNVKVSFNEGDSAYDVISKACKENNIHFDAVTTPLTGGKYIRGINNLYEFDCGNVSGWMYRVNGEFPNVGCSEYYLTDGDEVSFLYSCNLGGDIGNIYKGE